jgi:hypothetical protein
MQRRSPASSSCKETGGHNMRLLLSTGVVKWTSGIELDGLHARWLLLDCLFWQP